MSSEWGIKSVCLVSYMPVKSSWLKAILFHFCSPFPEYCWFCGFVLFGALIILSFFYSQLSVYEQIQKKVGPFCPSPASHPSAPGTLFRDMDWNIPNQRSGLCHLGLSCHNKNHTIHAVPEIQWSDSCFLSSTQLGFLLSSGSPRALLSWCLKYSDFQFRLICGQCVFSPPPTLI